MKIYRTLLADDHIMFRLGMTKILEDIDYIKVIGEANDGFELLQMIDEMSPNLVLLDISMPKIRGIEATREIKQIDPAVKVIILTMHNNMEYLQHSISAGADGYVLKQDAGAELFAAIKTVINGGIYISKTFTKDLTLNFIKKCHGDQISKPQTLTNRQREVLTLISQGETNNEIARLLFLSVRTVEKHRANIMAIKNLKTTADIVKYAIRKKYTSISNL
ncbi:MAG: response regulator transcription factor [Desulfobacula sp.]|uniref:response regulator n=1 Tax=Desulfobacula sp. TaxID=2593537 RepID=UPI001E0B3C4D|nr:response regulator transcription factor [Desulfobacula sp.]MBT6338382.1 response regulator transcription factor [Desulfobacula sp.]MBT6751380.1 response regulator transcription factor [Desulfobacula sp.]